MANPNIVNVAAIYGNTSSTSLSTTSATSILSNAASSGKIFKLGSLVVSNTSASAVAVTINLYSAAALGGTGVPVAYQISVPANASLIVVDKTTPLYILEDKSIGAIAGTAGALAVTASWEEINA
jgi:hypothetical protein